MRRVAKDPKSMRRILDMTGRKNIKAVFDPANLITPENADRADDVLKELFELNGNDIALLHAKGYEDRQRQVGVLSARVRAC